MTATTTWASRVLPRNRWCARAARGASRGRTALLILAAVAAVGADAESGRASVRVIRYAARVEPFFETRSIVGRVTVTFEAKRVATTTLALDAGELEIESAREGADALTFAKSGSRLLIDLPPRAPASAYSVDIEYRGRPTRGLSFVEDEVSTAFATDQWMPCVAAPSERATFDISLVLPANLVVAASGRHVGDQRAPDGRVESRWSLDRPTPSYLFGFAAGAFSEVSDRAAGIELRYLGPSRWSAKQLRAVFAATADMLAFFGSRAGEPYPGDRYTQVLLHASRGQELADLAELGESYGERVIEDPKAIWLGAHELAHQWWGNSVTNESWNHFWLNEGIATFMTAAYLEHRFGRDEYQRQIDAAKAKYDELLAAGRDKPLEFDDWSNPTAADRSIVYDKGAYVLHLLREELGDDAFWRGIALYTQRNWGRPVTARAFEAAMEEASGRDLEPFFVKWVRVR